MKRAMCFVFICSTFIGCGGGTENAVIEKLSNDCTDSINHYFEAGCESEVGQGATFRLALPLTLAIVQAMLVALGDDMYAVPLTSVVESLYLSDAEMGSVKGRPVIQWRESVLPLLHLRQFFAHPRLTAPASGTKSAVVVVTWGKQRVGLIVDRLIGKQEIVIKSLGGFVGNVTGVSGCTILGDGRIALIADIPGIIGATLRAQREEVSE